MWGMHYYPHFINEETGEEDWFGSTDKWAHIISGQSSSSKSDLDPQWINQDQPGYSRLLSFLWVSYTPQGTVTWAHQNTV